MAIGDPTLSTLTISGPAFTPGTGTHTLAVFGPTVVNTSGFSFGAGTIVRTDLRSWAEFGFVSGMPVTIDGVPAGTATINGYTMFVSALGSWTAGTHTVAIFDLSAKPVLMGGDNITISGGGGPGRGAVTPTMPAGSYSVSGSTLTRTTGSWIADGFVYGQVLQIGPSPAWKVVAVTALALTVSGPAIGDTTGMSLQGFSPSPLVVFGDTSQDGVWYSGDPHTMTQRDFGPKPFPTTIGNGTPDFIFPVADPFRYAGNDYIDATALFAAVPNGQVPSVGVTLYGGAGNDTIVGSQANDFIAGGSGNNAATSSTASVDRTSSSAPTA